MFRRATDSDCKLLFEWVNDSDVRANSFTINPVLWDEHVKWFCSRDKDNRHIFIIVEEETNIPVGQVRFELGYLQPEVMYSVAKGYRLKGYASDVVPLLCKEMMDTHSLPALWASILDANTVSQKVITKAGFVLEKRIDSLSSRWVKRSYRR